jgi:protein-L-isoaspartate(D-aspartate) O-methyltransferase
MVEQLRRLGITDPRVLDSISRVPRERFVRDEHRDVAYGDHALPIGLSQTISQPYVVARMTELLDVRIDHHVLEIGTGSGYQAAVLSALAGDVISLERHAALADEARARLESIGYPNITVVQADGSLGYPEAAPYDRILVTAASPQIAPELAAQLKPGGLIVAPVGDEELQELVVRDAGGHERRHGAVRFVPLLGAAGFER